MKFTVQLPRELYRHILSFLPKRVMCDTCYRVFIEPLHYRPIPFCSYTLDGNDNWTKDFCSKCRKIELARFSWRINDFYKSV